MSTFQLYMVLKLDDFRNAAGVVAAVSGILLAVGIILGIATVDMLEDIATENIRKWAKRIAVVFVISLTTVTALPTTKQFLIIWAVPKIANNERLGRISGKGLDALEEAIDGLKEYVGKAKKEEGKE